MAKNINSVSVLLLSHFDVAYCSVYAVTQIQYLKHELFKKNHSCVGKINKTAETLPHVPDVAISLLPGSHPDCYWLIANQPIT